MDSITFESAVLRVEQFSWDDELLEPFLQNIGSSSPEYFHNLASGGLLIQQVPAEFSALIRYLRGAHPEIEKYLEIGVGSCGTLTLLSEFWRFTGAKPQIFAADNFTYATLPQRERFHWA